jgi:hypothetical protein
MRALRRVGVLVAFVAILGSTLDAADAKPRKRTSAVVLHPRLHRTDKHVDGIASNGRYVFLLQSPSYLGEGELIDGRTGDRTSISRPGCSVDSWIAQPFGGPWLMFDCLPTGAMPYEALYRLTDRTWKVLPPPPNFCAGAADACGYSAIAVGADWVEWVTTCYHCNDARYFQNIWTGEVRTLPSWQPGSTTVPDLNSTGLASQLCAPLRVPAVWNLAAHSTVADPGTISLFGRNAIAWGSDADGVGSMYLERCASRLHRRIGPAFPPPEHLAAGPFLTRNADALMWGRSGRLLAGVFLPTLTPLTVSLPASVNIGRIALGSRTLYLWDTDTSEVWTMPAPKRPRARSK